MNQLAEKKFDTELGQIKCELFSDTSNCSLVGKVNYENGKSETYQTDGHQIELIEFNSRTHKLVKDSKCWIFRITKLNDSKERLKITCALSTQNDDVEFDKAPGEHLEAIEGYNEKWQVHIGTEDGEVMNWRAEDDDWFPNRLKSSVNFYESITTYLKGDDGLQTEIPELKKDEKIYLQYLSAVAPKKEGNINCWTAVDESKRNLENWIGIS